jgi:hypothetical protein
MFIFVPFLHACYYYTLQIDTNSLAALGCLLVDDTYDTDIESLWSESSPMPEMTKSQRIRYLRIWLSFFLC